LVVTTEHFENQFRLVIQGAGKPPGEEANPVAFQGFNFGVESGDMLGAIIVSEPSETKVLEHRSAGFGAALRGVERDNAPGDQVAAGEQPVGGAIWVGVGVGRRFARNTNDPRITRSPVQCV
jgi:hypothetical protein